MLHFTQKMIYHAVMTNYNDEICDEEVVILDDNQTGKLILR